MYSTDVIDLEKMADELPKPTGYRVLVAAAKVEEKKGSVFMTEVYRSLEDTASILGCVISIGPDAYANKERFPAGPYCKVGDWVMFRSYSGTRFKLKDAEFRLLNDDQIEAVIDDPRSIERV